VNAPGTPTVFNYTVNIPSGADGTAGIFSGWGTTDDDLVQASNTPTNTATYVARIHGVIRTGGTGGTLIPRFQAENANNVSIKTYSWATLTVG
jgi:hypothetical protein